MKKLPIAAGAVVALVGVSVPVVMLTQPAFADDDTERTITCGQARVELNVDKEGNRFEVDGDIDNAAAGSSWKVTLRHDGAKVFTRTLTADSEGDLDVEANRANSAGSDVFKLRVKNIDTGAKACTVTVTTR